MLSKGRRIFGAGRRIGRMAGLCAGIGGAGLMGRRMRRGLAMMLAAGMPAAGESVDSVRGGGAGAGRRMGMCAGLAGQGQGRTAFGAAREPGNNGFGRQLSPEETQQFLQAEAERLQAELMAIKQRLQTIPVSAEAE